MRHYKASAAGCRQLTSLFVGSRTSILEAISASPQRRDFSFPPHPDNHKRFFSKSTSEWISRFRFGTDSGMFFGVPIEASDEAAQFTRKLYCRALLYASGGSTMARDWIAGCSALMTSDDAILSIALQHLAKANDVVDFRAHILKRLLQEDEHDGAVSPGKEGNEMSNILKRNSPSEAWDRSKVSVEEIRKMENYVLQDSAIVRCFLYDAMTASLFKCRDELSIVEEARQWAFDLNAQYFGLPAEDLTAIWRLVIAEFILKEEKKNVLGQPWGD
ncbi:unnamed protein product [Phytomonas sp. Hart1]|nr:unnamed protein product [Phytomonas sp. Hart1]|eukprot:CCW69802.1 unnamed protein product [Phytomonas sp. isolate Hart1]